MKRYYMFYTGEGYTLSPNDELIQNYQILGFSKYTNEDNALELFLSENPWIVESGFSPEKIQNKIMLCQ